jgi:hypothetical protein
MSKNMNIWLRYNQRILNWTKETWDLQSQNLQNAIKNGTDETLASLKYVNARQDGMVHYAGFRFNRKGIFLEKGVGGVYHVKSGELKRKTPGPINRVPKPWLRTSFEQQMPKLSAIVSEEFAEITSGTLADALERIVKLKGIM